MPERIAIWPETPPCFDPGLLQPEPSLTLYPAEHAKGALIILPGGGYHYKAEHEGAPIARRFNEAGIFTAVLDYRVTPYRAPVPQWDAMRAVQYMRTLAAQYGYQPDHVAVLGFSAGGHLAASISCMDIDMPAGPCDACARMDPRPDAGILCYPVITMGFFTHVGSRENLLGMDADAALIDQWSVERNVSVRTPPLFLWHTSDDGAVPVQNSLSLAMSLKEKGLPFSLHIWPHGQHGLGLAEGVPDVARWPDLAAEWLKAIGY